jgi:hypothetical protein
MSASRDDAGQTAQGARRRAARQTVADYHEQQLRDLLEHVRDGLARLDRGEIDVFDVDALIERYDLAARKLRAFCGSTGADWERAADMLEFMRHNGDTHDWWDAAAARRR